MKTKKIFLSIASGILIILCFPNFSLSFIAWICLIPLLFSINKERPSKSFLYGLLTGITAYCGILYWIIPTFTTAGESFILGFICLVLLSAYCAIYIGIFCLMASHLKSSMDSSTPIRQAQGRCSGLLFYISSRGCKITNSIILSSIWVILEYIRSHFLSGFPWAIIGYSQWDFLSLIQISKFTGVYGVSFIIVLVNLTIFQLITIPHKLPIEPKNIWIKLKVTLPALVIFIIYLFYGFISLNSPSSVSSTIKVAILQGNVEQYKKWDETYRDKIMDVYTSLIRQAEKEFKPDLVIWPESSIPGYLLNDRILYKWIKGLIAESKCYHLIGAVEYRKEKFYNSILLFSPYGKMIDKYSKIHLVPFGEIVPFKSILERYIKTLNELGHFSPGDRYTVFQIPPAVSIGANICFESIFPYISRRLTRNGAQILVNLTNDAWYLKTSAPRQHFIFNIYRAVENHRMVIRSANTGISGLIDEHGRIVVESEIFKKLYKNISVKPIKKITFYTRYGDIFVLICFIIVVVRTVSVRLRSGCSNHESRTA